MIASDFIICLMLCYSNGTDNDKEDECGADDRPMVGAVADVLAVDCALWSTLRSRTDEDDVDASSGRWLNTADSDP